MNNIYPWKRFWCPRENTINLSDGGFLVDPEDEYGKFIQKDVVPFDKIQHFPCLILLGEPGIGKSTALKSEYEVIESSIKYTPDQVLQFNLNVFGSEDRLIREIFASDMFQSWKSGNHTLHLFLDSLDECRLNIQHVGTVLENQFKKLRHNIDRLRIRIACRTSDYPNILENKLPSLWNQKDENGNAITENVGIFEVAPLRRKDVKIAAETNNIDGERFIDQLFKLEVVPLAIKPITLEFLISSFKDSGELPSSKVSLYEQGCLQLCVESNPNRQDLRASGGTGSLSASQRLSLASRIAAVTILCRKPVLLTTSSGSPSNNDELVLTELTSGQEIAGTDRIDATEDNIRETLGTGLFSGRGPHRMGFAHQSYAEFLAARYLNNHNLDSTRIDSLLIHQDDSDSKIIPQLHETAAWLASMNAEVFHKIAYSDPQVLLKADVERFSDEDKGKLTESLLILLEQGKINTRDWDLYRSYHKLTFPGLADTLRPFIDHTKTEDINVRDLAIVIAEACKITELQNLLADIALYQSEPIRIRDGAARAVWQIGDKPTRNRFRPLALGEAGEDPEDQLKGNALRALWPDQITASELFDILTAPKCENLHGSYMQFMWYELIDHLKPEDLHYALSWIEKQTQNKKLTYSLHRFADDIILMAWNNFEVKRVLDGLTCVSIALYQQHTGIIEDRDMVQKNDKLFDEPEKRLKLLTAIVNACQDFQIIDHGLTQYFPRLVRSEDLTRILEKLETSASDEIASRWAKLARHIFYYQTPGHLDMVLEACKQSPVLEQEFRIWFEPVKLDSERARKMKEYFKEEKKWEEQRTQDKNPQVLEWLPRDRIQHGLECFEKKEKIDAWNGLCASLTLTDTSQRYEHLNELDLTKLPGWQNSDESTRQRILNCAVGYLTKKPSDPLKWIRCPNQYYTRDLLPYKAIYILKKYSPERLKAIPRTVWRKWIPTLLGVPFYSENRKDELNYEIIRDAYETWPDEFIFWIHLQIDAQNNKENHLSVHEKLERCWDDRLCESVLGKLKEQHIKPSFFRKLLETLIENSYRNSIEYAESLLGIPLPCDKEARERSHNAAIALLSCTDDTGWNVIWQVIQTEPDFGKELFLEVGLSLHFRGEGAGLAQRISENSIADLYIWLVQNFPFAEDPKHDGAHGVGNRERIAHVRDNLLRILENMGTSASVSAIENIYHSLPQLDWLKSVLVEAKKNKARSSWNPVSPKQLMELTRIPGSRFVQNALQLQNVIIESLRRLEIKLQGESPAAPDIWDQIDKTKGQEKFRPKDENHLSDYIKRHLEEELNKCGIIALREVQIRRGEGSGRGENTDIHVTGIIACANENFTTVKVIIEVKGCWHQELKTSMQTQLVDRYLKDNDCQHGIYLIGWFKCPQWENSDYRCKQTPNWEISKAQCYFDKQAQSLSSGGKVIKAAVINTALR